MSATLDFRDVTKRHPGGQGPAVCGVTLRVERGELLALVGESGSGKTTLLRLASGLESPGEGEIRVGDRLVAGKGVWVPPEKRGIGLVFQDGALFPHLKVAANVSYGLRGRPEAEVREVVEKMLTLVGLGGKGERYPHELSGGERQRLAVARALAPQPQVLLLDEPFSNLDPALRRSLRDEIRTLLQDLRATAILVTHDTDDALSMGDRVAVMRMGRLEQCGPPREVYAHPQSGYCARLFGPANPWRGSHGEMRWVRPEEMMLLKQPGDGSSEAEIERVHDSGSHREVVLIPRAGAAGERWTVYAPWEGDLQPGTRVWVRVREG